MPFMSNFVAVTSGDQGLIVEGVTSPEGLADGERIFVGVPADAPDSPELTLYEASLGSDWSVSLPPGHGVIAPLTLVGILVLRDKPPFVWSQKLGFTPDVEPVTPGVVIEDPEA